MSITHDVLTLIGHTPLLQISRLDTGVCQLFAKLENQNPGGSIKDRIALTMIEAAEKTGKLRPGMRIIEATAGNTGIALALVAASKGYPVQLVIPDKMSQEKIAHLRALKAEVIITRSDVSKGHPDYFQDVAARLAKEQGNTAYHIDQFANPNNVKAHEEQTGPEIWEQMNHQIDAIVVGVGSGGTLTGIGRFLRRVAPHIEIVLADPKGSVLAGYVSTKTIGPAGSWLVEGVGDDFIPPICDLSLVSQAITVDDRDSFHTARALLNKEGVLAGPSSGTLLHAALVYCRAQTQPKRVVTFVCDTGNKYLSKLYSDTWLEKQGLL